MCIRDRYLDRSFYSVTEHMIQKLSQGMDVDESDKVLISRYCEYGMTGLLLGWLDVDDEKAGAIELSLIHI